VHHWQVSRGWQFLGFSRKQPTNKNAKQDPTDQQAYLYLPPPAGVYGVNCQLIIDVDEFGTQLFNVNMPLAHAPRGQKAVQVAPTKIGKKYTTIIAACTDCVVCAATFDAAGVTNEIFYDLIVNVLLPRLPPGCVLTMDNLRQHKWQSTVNAIVSAGHTLIFRPKYSPEFGPIEQVIHKIKSCLRAVKYGITEQSIPEFIDAAVVEACRFYGIWRDCGL
jgi:transposase